MEHVIQSAVTTISSVVVVVVTAIINQRMKERDRKADERHEEAEAERNRRDVWREGMSARVGKLEATLDVLLRLYLSQMRSDITHKCHRYIDDLHAASTEEKDSLWAEYEDYRAVCDAHGIDNHYIDKLVEQTMELPPRERERF